MSCSGRVSNFERKKQALFNVNLWKSNFIALWQQYGTFDWVNGVQVFGQYDIRGAGTGPVKMSKHLRQPTLSKDVDDPDLAWVNLQFDLSRLVTVTPSDISGWVTAMRAECATYVYDTLKYEIADNVVTSHGFYSNGVLQSDDFLDRFSLFIAEYKRSELVANYVFGSGPIDFIYDALVTQAAVDVMIGEVSTHDFSITVGDYTSPYTVPMIEPYVKTYLMGQSLGTDILDAWVLEGVLVASGDVATGITTYSVPVDVAKKMGGYAFVQLVEKTLDFKYDVNRRWFDFLLKVIKLVIAVVAAYFGFYYIALSLIFSFAADVTGKIVFRVLSYVVGYLATGVPSLSDVGVGEAASLLMNVYGLYVELSYKPEQTTEVQEVSDDQEMFYRAPYAAYSNLYCYKNLISIHL